MGSRCSRHSCNDRIIIQQFGQMKIFRSISFFLILIMGVHPATGQDTDWAFEETPQGQAFIVPIEGMIDNGLARYIDRAVADAEAAEAGLIVFDIDTFGGLVDAADQIRKTILNATIPTVAFIDKNAASAGALISYAADRIIMVPGASIGAATVVEGVGGEAAPDKYQSYMRGLMRATAEANGRDPQIAEAMVDQELEVKGVSEAGQVLTLSTTEAVKLGVADAELTSIDELLSELGAAEIEQVAHEVKGIEQMLRFFGSPVVQSILMLMMMGGLYFELQTPGVGFPGIIAAFGAAIFFGPHYMMGLVESWEILVFGLGIILLMLEIFVIPGFGIAGISGLILVVLAMGASLIGNIGFNFPSGPAITSAVTTLASTMVMFIIMLASLARYLPKTQHFNRLVLQPDLGSAAGYTSATTHSEYVGRHGIAATSLRPAGAATIDGSRVDVVTSGEYIEKGTPIEVMTVNGSTVRVKAVPQIPS
jgi:membrane-bound serine protease (ClpP class)